jgi:hypothetical protein
MLLNYLSCHPCELLYLSYSVRNCSFVFVHGLNYKFIKLQVFESWILLSCSGKKGSKRIENLFFGSLVVLTWTRSSFQDLSKNVKFYGECL